MDWTTVLLSQLTSHWDLQVRSGLDGLTDDEYLWEPGPGAWSIRPRAEARAEHKPFVHHLAHLAVHGFLHLAGYDHQADDEADAMEKLETLILAQLAIPDPYIARGAPDRDG